MNDSRFGGWTPTKYRVSKMRVGKRLRKYEYEVVRVFMYACAPKTCVYAQGGPKVTVVSKSVIKYVSF